MRIFKWLRRWSKPSVLAEFQEWQKNHPDTRLCHCSPATLRALRECLENNRIFRLECVAESGQRGLVVCGVEVYSDPAMAARFQP